MEQASFVNNFKEDQVKDILLRYYGLRSTRIKLLMGYEKPNILVYPKHGAKCPSHILKADSENNEQAIQIVMSVLYQLFRSGLPVPFPVMTLSREWVHKAELGHEKDSYLFTLLTFMPGDTLTNVKVSQSQLNSIAYQCGSMFAKLDKKIMNVCLEKRLDRVDFSWDVANDKFCKSKFQSIDDDDLRASCVEIDKLFDEQVPAVSSELREGLIHGDGNEANIIVTCDLANKDDSLHNEKAEWKLAGLIDFGDMYEGKIVFEIATLMVYMMNKAWHSNLDPEKAAGMALKGFNSVLPLNEKEQDVLLICVMKRMVVSICSSSYEKKKGCHEQISKDLSSMSSLVQMIWKKSSCKNILFL